MAGNTLAAREVSGHRRDGPWHLLVIGWLGAFHSFLFCDIIVLLIVIQKTQQCLISANGCSGTGIKREII